MNGPRYKVATVTGCLTPRKGNSHLPFGLSAYVLDRLCAHRVVATFRSEDRHPKRDARGRIVGGRALGHDGARAAAEALATEWNAEEGFPNRRPPVKVAPDEPTARDRRGRV